MQIGNIVRFYRRLQDVSQLELAKSVGRSQSWLWRVEHGFALPSPDDLERLLRVLDIDPNKLETDL